ncbi:MAG: SHOCT domain-containing protein [Rhizobiaceae bacterium]|nr:SHOCT domain-containing protein [Rhizobiaceae bacterium]
MKALLPALLFPLLILTIASPVHAQDRSQVRELGKGLVDRLKAAGDPADRCSISADFRERLVISRTIPDAALQPGDRLLRIGDRSVEGMTVEQFLAFLHGTPPDASLAVVVDRGGDLVDVSVQCVNARPLVEPFFNAATHASRGRFDDCVSAINTMPHMSGRDALLRAQCAGVSRRSEQYDLAGFTIKAMELLIEEARYATEMRSELITRLGQIQTNVTNARGAVAFDALVEATRSWPGGETLYDDSAPDWLLFRRNSETTLRSKLIDPDSARIEWTRGFLLGYWRPFLSRRIEGYWTCGLINARNRMGGYTGSTAFVVVLSPQGQVLYSEIGTSDDMDVLTSSCANSSKHLPPAPPELSGQLSTSITTQPSASIADEIKKLVELRDAGALSPEEFEAAKVKILRPQGN